MRHLPSAGWIPSRIYCRIEPSCYIPTSARRRCSPRRSRVRSRRYRTCCFSNWMRLLAFHVDDVVEVSSYVAALEHGQRRLAEDFPLSNRLMREVHGILLSRGRGSDKLPGDFRRSQNWIGGTRPGNAAFVPPPHMAVPDCMADLERFLNEKDDGVPTLIRAGLAHIQFETIHPFLDGNGRVGRLMVALLLMDRGVLSQPLLYVSLYLKQHRTTYFSLLEHVRRIQATGRRGSPSFSKA